MKKTAYLCGRINGEEVKSLFIRRKTNNKYKSVQ